MRLQLKTKKYFLVVAVIGILAVIALWNLSSNAQQASSVLAGKSVTVVRSVTCGCCKNYVAYLKKRGMEVKEEFVKDIQATKAQYGVSQDLASCHTTLMDDYVIEGHIPTEVIEKLATDKPNIVGIALPGMPQGSPGMPGAKSESWDIYTLGQSASDVYTTF